MIYININVPISYQQSRGQVRHLALGRALVLPASCVFSPANPQIFFLCGLAGGRRTCCCDLSVACLASTWRA